MVPWLRDREEQWPAAYRRPLVILEAESSVIAWPAAGW